MAFRFEIDDSRRQIVVSVIWETSGQAFWRGRETTAVNIFVSGSSGGCAGQAGLTPATPGSWPSNPGWLGSSPKGDAPRGSAAKSPQTPGFQVGWRLRRCSPQWSGDPRRRGEKSGLTELSDHPRFVAPFRPPLAKGGRRRKASVGGWSEWLGPGRGDSLPKPPHRRSAPAPPSQGRDEFGLVRRNKR